MDGKLGKAVSYDASGSFEIQHHNSLNALKGKGHKSAGILDELSIFNRALTAAEAKTIYEDGEL